MTGAVMRLVDIETLRRSLVVVSWGTRT